jgi:hypothetical protein
MVLASPLPDSTCHGPTHLRIRRIFQRSHALGLLLLFFLSGWGVGLSGCGSNGLSPDESAPALSVGTAEPDALQLLRQMVAKYRSATRYGDRGQLQLRYRQPEGWVESQASLAVQLDAGPRLAVRAYELELICERNELRAAMQDRTSPQLGAQLLRKTISTPLTLEQLYADPVLRTALLGTVGRQPVQLELLFAERPLEPVLAPDATRRYLGQKRFEGHPCHLIEACVGDGVFTFWIDTQTLLLRRLEYPAAALLPELKENEVALVAELHDATFDPTPDANVFRIRDESQTYPVSAWVLAPPELPSQLFGQRVAPFAFTDPFGRVVDDRQLQGRITVLLWFHRHPACQPSLTGLARALSTWTGPRDRVACFAVCTEPSAVGNEEMARLLAEYGAGDLPLLRDYAAVGRDRFAIPGAPALVVCDPQGVIQVVEVGVNPELERQLPVVLDRLLAGHNLAAEIVQRYQEELADYESRLQAVRQPHR